jgi:hypothetical protein
MHQVKQFLLSIQPFSRRDNSRAEYVIQKFLAFALLYIVSCVVMEAAIILGFSALGYDVLHGVMPDHPIVGMLPLFGYVGFVLLTILYVKRIEKRPLSDILLRADKRSIGLLTGLLAAGTMWVALIMGLFVLSGVYSFSGIGGFSVTTVLWLLAFIIQGSAEELMCRGFFQNTLERRVSRPVAVAFSALVFILPHTLGLSEMGLLPMLVSLVNLALVSLVFSFLMIRTGSVLASCGLHAGWNFALGTIFGVNVSGMSASGGLIRLNANDVSELLTGGVYGIEASIILVPVLLFAALVCYRGIRRGER